MKELLVISPLAAELDSKMLHTANMMFERADLAPSSEGFRKYWLEFLDIFERYQKQVIKDNAVTPTCKSGCAFCCMHWVEDVYSFEAMIIASELKTCFDADNLEIIRGNLAHDESELNRIAAIIDDKLSTMSQGEEELDYEELLLASFYQLSHQCPLVDESGQCCIYDHRPITCRAYCNFGSSDICRPENINNPGEVSTYLLEPGEKVSLILDELHLRFNSIGTTGLRSALLKLL